jgi:hypothetical protein
MSEKGPVENAFKNMPEGKRKSAAKPRNRWLDDVEKYSNKLGVRGWKKISKNKDAWKLILKEARVLHGQHRL